MDQFLLLYLCLGAGILLRIIRKLPSNTPEVLNGFIFYISFPALVFSQFSKVALNSEVLIPASVPWVSFALAFLVFYLARRWLTRDSHKLGSLVLTTGLGNTSFVGFPMLLALCGPDALKTGILVDQLGTFLVLSTLGLGTASFFSSTKVSLFPFLKRIFSFPPVYALLGALILRPFVTLPSFVDDALTKLGMTITPLALVSVGFQLRLDWKVLKQNQFLLTLGLLFKLIISPALLALLYIGILGFGGEGINIALLEGAMAPMITAAIVAAEYRLDTDLANLMLGIGIPLSFITVPLWSYVLSHWL